MKEKAFVLAVPQSFDCFALVRKKDSQALSLGVLGHFDLRTATVRSQAGTMCTLNVTECTRLPLIAQIVIGTV